MKAFAVAVCVLAAFALLYSAFVAKPRGPRGATFVFCCQRNRLEAVIGSVGALWCAVCLMLDLPLQTEVGGLMCVWYGVYNITGYRSGYRDGWAAAREREADRK